MPVERRMRPLPCRASRTSSNRSRSLGFERKDLSEKPATRARCFHVNVMVGRFPCSNACSSSWTRLMSRGPIFGTLCMPASVLRGLLLPNFALLNRFKDVIHGTKLALQACKVLIVLRIVACHVVEDNAQPARDIVSDVDELFLPLGLCGRGVKGVAVCMTLAEFVTLNLREILDAVPSGGRMSDLNQRLSSGFPLARRDLIEQVRKRSMIDALFLRG
ncbi:Uncharacterised protein [Burkholderia pseudomallei]|nr:Uncharacterised protein [Burkholderia pseudomallei]